MGQYLVKKSTLHGELIVPSSKSQTLRAILFAALAEGKSYIHNYLNSPDTDAMINAFRLFGAKIHVFPSYLEIDGIHGNITQCEDVIQAGNSGIVLRFCSAIGALSPYPVVITGDHSIRHQRPMQPLIEGLSQLAVSIKTMRGDNFAPLIIEGPIQTGKITLSGEDSQHVSALLIASAFAKGPIEINVHNPGEKPWIAMTLEWFDRLGISYQNNAFEWYRVEGNSRYQGFDYVVPGDFSSAAFPIAAALITQSELLLKNLDMHDSQGDKKLIEIFQNMGAEIIVNDKNKTLHVKKGSVLTGITIDINECIDAVTILAVVGCFAAGETRIQNATIAKQKECDRLKSITNELKKMSAHIEETSDGLFIKQSELHGAQLHSYHDHRMAMSLTVAGLAAYGETTITPVKCISKTFSTFFRDFKEIGADIQEVS